MASLSFFSIDSGRGPPRNFCRSFASEGGFQGTQGSTVTAIRRTFLAFFAARKLFGMLVTSLSLTSFSDLLGVSRDSSATLALCEISLLNYRMPNIGEEFGFENILEMMRKSRCYYNSWNLDELFYSHANVMLIRKKNDIFLNKMRDKKKLSAQFNEEMEFRK